MTTREHVVETDGLLPRHGLLIGADERPGRAEPLVPLNPATGKPIAVVDSADERDIDDAVQIAQASFAAGAWRDQPIQERARVLWRLADTLEDCLGELAELETRNNGRPVVETRAQINRLPEWYRYNASLLLADRDHVTPMPGEYHSYTSRFPLGTVAILAPFNHPLMIASKSLAPALATGNSVVLKPSELTPLTALRLGRAALDAGVPPGVLSIVPGSGPKAGARLAEHPDIAKIVFTGGTEPGRAVARAAAGRFARCTLELGGSTPVVVFDDAAADAVAGAAFAAFVGAGQTCIAGRRFFVQESAYEAFVTGLVELAAQIRIGDPADPDTQLGPLISAGALARVLGKVDAGERGGAQIRHGGRAAAVQGMPGGFFMEPTVCTLAEPGIPLAREEIFGPVAVVMPFASEDDAVALANDSPYGLGAAVWTHDVARAHRVAARLRCGMVWVNDHHRLDPSSPWGGIGDSGVGREGGWESFHDFTNVRAITVRTARSAVQWYGSSDQGRLN
jgi:acyl-CoA reductase-like NAD-dependent aldehyde dehydrogenase